MVVLVAILLLLLHFLLLFPFPSFITKHIKFVVPADGSVTKAEFQQGWVTSEFGSSSDADAIFMSLDHNHDGVLATSEIAHLRHQYDVSRE